MAKPLATAKEAKKADGMKYRFQISAVAHYKESMKAVSELLRIIQCNKRYACKKLIGVIVLHAGNCVYVSVQKSVSSK